MRTDAWRDFSEMLWKACHMICVALLLSAIFPSSAMALTITVNDADGAAVTDFRWLVEEDRTVRSRPGKPDNKNSLSLGFHRSHMPVVASGRVGAQASGPDPATLALDPNKRYFVSVLPDGGVRHMSGGQLAAGQNAITIVVGKGPIPTAQIAVFVFEDNNPINNGPDQPEERGLGGFNVQLAEAGGTYGQNGGQVTQDAYGNPIGTEYVFVTKPNGEKDFQLDADGNPVIATRGNGYVTTGPDGRVLLKYLAPAKYTVFIVPPVGEDWMQTTTIEGSKGIDAWVGAKNPPLMIEIGPPLPHIFAGFVRPFNAIPGPAPGTGTGNITGRPTNLHMARSFDGFAFNSAEPLIKHCIVGLNEISAGVGGRGVYAARCNPDGTFTIPNVPAGLWQLVVWDEFLDLIIYFAQVEVPVAGGNVALGDIPIFDWFHRMDAYVFWDTNQNGFPDESPLVGIPEQAVNLRFRDGSIYQSFATDAFGYVPFEEVFPFFYWLVAEVDFARYKATGATIVVDAGGAVPPDNGWDMPSYNLLNPQPQTCSAADVADGVAGCAAVGNPLINPNTGNNLSRTETGPVLLEGYQGFLGQVNVLHFGKASYPTGENGGITGIVYYAATRAENDPRFAAAENNEPGIPRIQVNLYRDCDNDTLPDKPRVNPAATTCKALSSQGHVWTPADADNYPLGWADGGAKGPEDIDRNGNGLFDKGDAYDVGWSDSWDDNLPTGCPGPEFTINGVTTDCLDGLRNWNQVRPALFDGGYAFGSPAGKPEIPVGQYIVEVAVPPGYEILREEHKNVDFGPGYTPSPVLLPPVCVGDPHVVPPELSLFPGIPTEKAGQTVRKCDRLTIDVAQGKNSAANFFLVTEVPRAAQIVGFTANDVGNEFSVNSPLFGEKYAPPHMPISVQDWAGNEVSRFYTGEFGAFNGLVPSTFAYNIPFPSGVAPNVLTACMNSPGPIPDPASPGRTMIDPNFSPGHAQLCYPFQFLPGKTTYLDTPVVSVAAFADNWDYPLDCEMPQGAPVIYSVEGFNNGVSNGGPFVSTALPGPRTLVIKSAGMETVTNPDFDAQPGSSRTIQRNNGFGVQGANSQVRLGDTLLPILSWTPDEITVRVNVNKAQTGQLMVRRHNGNETVAGVTVTVDASTPKLVGPDKPYKKIQAAINQAQPGDLILVSPGTYSEMVIMHKKVRLQGSGALSTIINAAKSPPQKLETWRNRIANLFDRGAFDLVPGQPVAQDVRGAQMGLFGNETGSAVLVVAKASGPEAFDNAPNARIDGFMITGGDQGGGILVSGYARYLEISNNKLQTNQGSFAGAIRVGHPQLVDPAKNPATDMVTGGYTDADNDNILIHHNHIAQNGGFGGAGAGVSLYAGSDNYRVASNYICGNFALGFGGGIGHLGLSPNGTIEDNVIIFNETFNQGLDRSGGGIFVGGQAPLAVGTLSPGSGSVTIARNRIQGNLAGVGDGGGISAASVSGLDVVRAPDNPAAWYKLSVVNNMVTNNVTGLAGGGIALQNTLVAEIVNNTVAANDSTATMARAFVAGDPNRTVAQPAGIISRAHTGQLQAAMAQVPATLPYRQVRYSDPTLLNNIIWQNRSFSWQIDSTTTPPTFGLLPNVANGEAPVYWDLGVVGAEPNDLGPPILHPHNSVLTDTTGYAADNISVDPAFLSPYVNGDPRVAAPGRISTAAAFDEGGNFISVRYGPLKPVGDYHLGATSPARGLGVVNGVTPLTDYDGEPRPQPGDLLGSIDAGADERN